MSLHSQPTQLSVKGMTCANCALGITKYLEKQGLEDVYVNFTTSEVRFKSSDHINISSIIEGIETLGYRVVEPTKPEPKQTRNRFSALEWQFLLTLPFTLVLISSMFVPVRILNDAIVQLFVCIPVFLPGLYYFGKSALGSLRTGVLSMDVLITIGSSAAFVYSLIGTINGLGHDYLFYETAASIISLVLLGNVIEHRSVKQTTTAIRDLTELQPQKANLVTRDEETGKETITETNTAALKKGDILRVNTGDRIALDGRIIDGIAQVDESMISGESLPVAKNRNDKVIGGTINVAGSFLMEVTATGNETVLSNIIQMVKDAQQSKPAIQKLADRISAVFVPVVLGISAITLLVSIFLFSISFQGAMMQAIAVLVIACPCAMGLATPTAVMVGLGRMAKSGILIKGGATIEKLTKIEQIVFDKTGTLTTGNFRISRMQSNGMAKTEFEDILFSLEQHSSHPIAKSVVSALSHASLLPLKQVNETKGLSISGIDEMGNRLEAGSYNIARNQTAEDNHNIYVLRNDKLIGWADMEDEIRPEAKHTITYLKKQGIKTIMLSGDRQAKCKSVAEELGMDEYYAEQSPEQKLDLIEKLSNQSATAMVGDGINDAPALAKAYVGISLSNATQIAIQSADVILLNGDLKLIEKTMALGRLTVRTIKQNLFWAFFYNVMAIPIAAVGLLKPIYAALSMAFSDVFVIGNSIWLKSKKAD